MHISLGELFPDNELLSALDVFDLHVDRFNAMIAQQFVKTTNSDMWNTNSTMDGRQGSGAS